ncbi:MAG: M10 family metallopeptidase C-terminal domain-containing protein [Hyphomicrobiaceae bacterium]|nr:M10 family metallopeptidase C-terminal domain-containing protein [Hyphomicrobiaceae bacterium]
MATEGSDTLFFSGTATTVSATFVNAYDGLTATLDGVFNVNNTIYDGLGGNDFLLMTNNADFLTIVNEAGQQTLFNVEFIVASDGNDFINLSSLATSYGSLTISAGLGNDIIWANSGSDTLSGSGGNDVLHGGPGNDILNGDNDNDSLYGGDGNDILVGGNGSDITFGGLGDDTHRQVGFQTNGDVDVIHDNLGTELNIVEFTAGETLSDLIFSFDGSDLLIENTAINNFYRIVDQFAQQAPVIDRLQFSDGSMYELGGSVLTYTEGDGAAKINETIALPASLPATLSSAVVAVTEGFAATEDVLGFTNQNGIIGAFDPILGTLTLSGAASVADYAAALRSVTYINTSEAPSTIPRNVSFQIDDGAGQNTFARVAFARVEVAAVNDAPVVSLANGVATLPENTDTTAPIKIADIVVTDVDAGTNTLSLAGSDADKFSVQAGALFLNASAVLDFETDASLEVTVTVDDASIGSTFEDSVDFVVAITDVDESVVANADAFSFAENTTEGGASIFSGNLFADNGSGLDGNPSGGPLAIIRVNGQLLTPDPVTNLVSVAIASGGSIEINTTTGDFEFLFGDAYDFLPQGATTTTSLTYAVSDGLLGEDTATATFTITGIDSNDRFTGTDLAATTRAGVGNDIVNALGGNDIVFGGTGNDSLDGGVGNDRLFGEAGNDSLRGSFGIDVLTGGLGRDFLTGGGQRDVFDYNILTESRGALRDRITDFQRRIDDIDLSTLDANTRVAGNQRFKFIGDDAFSRTAGEVHAVRAGSLTRVEGDVNGDGRADFAIDVSGTAPLSAGDFIL